MSKRAASAIAPGGKKTKSARPSKLEECGPLAARANPPWLKATSAIKLRQLWRSRDRVFCPNIDMRTHIKIYGVARFLADHRDEILYGEDVHQDRKALLALLSEEEACEVRLATQRTLLRIHEERILISLHDVHALLWQLTRVNSIGKHCAVLHRDISLDESTVFYYSSHERYTLRVQEATSVRKRWVRYKLSELETKRCARLDSLEAAVFGAEHEAAEVQRLNGTYTPPPIGRFVTDPLFDKNLWGLIAKLV